MGALYLCSGREPDQNFGLATSCKILTQSVHTSGPYSLEKSHLFCPLSKGGDSTRAWVPGGRGHWGHLGDCLAQYLGGGLWGRSCTSGKGQREIRRVWSHRLMERKKIEV